ncbi:MAG: hypothetical protein AAFY08_15095 [Planctomycetota bacterium]
MKRTTLIQTRLDGDQWVATTPHAPELSARSPREPDAVNALVAQVRSRPPGQSWITDPRGYEDDGAITRRVSGAWPADPVEPTHPTLNPTNSE